MISSEKEILKVLKVPKERTEQYLKCLEMMNKIEDKHNYLVKYSLIKEEKGYIIAYSSDSHGDDEFSEYETSDAFADQMIRKL